MARIPQRPSGIERRAHDEVAVHTDGTGGLFYEIDPASNLRLAQTAEKEQPKNCNSYTDSC